MGSPLNRPRAQRTIAFLFLALVLFGVMAGLGRSLHTTSPSAPIWSLGAGSRSRVLWPANGSGLRARLAALGLPALPREGTALHIHAHLDVFVDGRRVVVPPGIGIDPRSRFISPLHTHDASGIIHVESPTVRTFTLGQFFGVWGVRFGDGCLGGYCRGHGQLLRVYADGRPVARPRSLALAEHQEIVVAFGTARRLPRPVPARYAFPPGL